MKKYTLEQLMPVKACDVWSRLDEHDIVWAFAGDWYKDYLYETTRFQLVIPIPGAPEEVKPLALPNNKPSMDGWYVAHQSALDEWGKYYYSRISGWLIEGTTRFLQAGAFDYFIPINLDGESEEEVGDVIWNTDELKVIVDEQVELQDAWTKNFITVPTAELDRFAEHWLTMRGHEVTKRTPELLPCPNPECKCRQAVYVETEDELYFVLCDGCGYCGPQDHAPEEAIRMHNLIAEGHA